LRGLIFSVAEKKRQGEISDVYHDWLRQKPGDVKKKNDRAQWNRWKGLALA